MPDEPMHWPEFEQIEPAEDRPGISLYLAGLCLALFTGLVLGAVLALLIAGVW